MEFEKDVISASASKLADLIDNVRFDAQIELLDELFFDCAVAPLCKSCRHLVLDQRIAVWKAKYGMPQAVVRAQASAIRFGARNRADAFDDFPDHVARWLAAFRLQNASISVKGDSSNADTVIA